jgi:hypothetical protein
MPTDRSQRRMLGRGKDMKPEAIACGGFPLALVGGIYVVHTREELAATLSNDLEGRATPLKAALCIDGGSTLRVLQSLIGEPGLPA